MSKFIKAMYSPRGQFINQMIAIILIVIFATALTINVGVPTIIIVARSATIGFYCDSRFDGHNVRQSHRKPEC